MMRNECGIALKVSVIRDRLERGGRGRSQREGERERPKLIALFRLHFILVFLITNQLLF